jgi:hypothetical protein
VWVQIRGRGEDRIERGRELRVPIADEQPSPAGTVMQVHQQVADLLGHPRPGTSDRKPMRLVNSRTVGDGLALLTSQESAAATLGLPFSTYRRHLSQGMTRFVSLLWEQGVYGPDRAEVSSS